MPITSKKVAHYKLVYKMGYGHEKQLQASIPDIYNQLDEVRKSVLLNMCISIPQSRFAPPEDRLS